MKSILIPLLIILPLCSQFVTARTLFVAADSTEEFLYVADAAAVAEAGDTVLVRDGLYAEDPFTVDSGIVVVAEHSGQVQLWMLNPDWVFVTLNGNAKIVGFIIVGHFGGFGQTLVEIYGGPATIYNCLFYPQAHYGLQMAFYCAGQQPFIRYCDFYTLSAASPIVNNFDTTNVWMPYNYYHTTDTVALRPFFQSQGGGHTYISPVLDSFQWLSVEERMPQIPQIHDLHVYPNPTNGGNIFLVAPNPGMIRQILIYNVLGQCVWTIGDGIHSLPLTVSREIPLEVPLTSGIYFISIVQNNFRQTAKFTIIR